MSPSPFNPRTTREAAQWLTETMEGRLSPEQQQALEHWRAAHPDNERAWQHIEALRRRMAGLEPQAGYKSLSLGKRSSRRQTLKTLVLLGLFGCAGQLAYRNVWRPSQTLTYSNGASAPQHITLEDGSQLTLDADTEVAVQFDSQQRRFTPTRIEPATANQTEPAWSKGLLMADNMRLDAFVEQLSRYRPGLLRCSDEVAALRISGVYPLADTDAVLDALPHSLPLQVQRRSRYWVTLSAR